MQIVVLLWAQMRLATGHAKILLDLPSGSSLGDALDRFYAAHPELELHRSTARPAVGTEYAHLDTTLHDGDEVSLIPPVQGG